MKTFSSKRNMVWLLVSVVMLIALGAAGAAASSATAAKTSVPFTASVSGSAIVDLDAGTIKLAGTGTASHLGNVKSYNANGSITSPTTDILTETLTAANGDTLTIFCSQVVVDLGNGLWHGTDTWTVIGGTGRFSGASGSGTGETNVDLNLGKFTKAMTGVIAY
jgi:hypothetical protein